MAHRQVRASEPSGLARKKRNLSVSTILILFLAAAAGVLYYFGTPPTMPPAITATNSCSSLSVQVVIPQGAGTNSSVHFQPHALTVVIGTNNTVTWNDQDSAQAHKADSFAVPPSASQWNFDRMTFGNQYCVTLTAPGTYTYKLDSFESQIVVKNSA